MCNRLNNNNKKRMNVLCYIYKKRHHYCSSALGEPYFFVLSLMFVDIL